jgi:nucleotide-binding universal stress UspA family protein
VKKLNRILVAVDYSAPARAAFDRAVALSRKHNAELLVVHAVPADRLFRWEGRDRGVLMASLRRAGHAAGVRPRISIQQGDPAGVILLHARSRGADLIVVGTSARSAFDRFRFGSVAERVTWQATQPVLVVPAAGAAGGVAPFNNVVVAVDFSDSSRAALERALSIAGDDSRVTVTHVLPGMAYAGGNRFRYGLMEREFHREMARDARTKIAEMIAPAATASKKVHVRLVSGDPSEEIARVAAEADADLILVGVTRRGAIARRLFTSTAARVIRRADVAVLAVAA